MVNSSSMDYIFNAIVGKIELELLYKAPFSEIFLIFLSPRL